MTHKMHWLISKAVDFKLFFCGLFLNVTLKCTIFKDIIFIYNCRWSRGRWPGFWRRRKTIHSWSSLPASTYGKHAKHAKYVLSIFNVIDMHFSFNDLLKRHIYPQVISLVLSLHFFSVQLIVQFHPFYLEIEILYIHWTLSIFPFWDISDINVENICN